MKGKQQISDAERLARAKRMKQLHADPQFAAAVSERMKQLHIEPEFAAKTSGA